MRHTLRLQLQPWGAPVLHLWCPTCLRSSGVQQSFVVSSERATMDIWTFRVCRDCRRHLADDTT